MGCSGATLPEEGVLSPGVGGSSTRLLESSTLFPCFSACAVFSHAKCLQGHSFLHRLATLCFLQLSPPRWWWLRSPNSTGLCSSPGCCSCTLSSVPWGHTLGPPWTFILCRGSEPPQPGRCSPDPLLSSTCMCTRAPAATRSCPSPSCAPKCTRFLQLFSFHF